LGALGGLFVDSLLGPTAERRGWLNNDAVNFLSTFATAVIAVVFFAIHRLSSPVGTAELSPGR